MVNVVHVGLGPIGIEIARLASQRGFRAIGAVDPAPGLVGRALSEFTGGKAHRAVMVAPAVGDLRADIALLSTGSRLAQVEGQILELIEAGMNVVTTCEELSYPWRRNAAGARRVNEAARQQAVTVLGTGVNPGYAMDYLPLVLTAPCQLVQAVRVHRVQDAMQRRVPLQRKVGAGLSVREFAGRVAGGELGHVGLLESADHLAAVLNWDVELTETVEPLVAHNEIRAAVGVVKPGEVRGIHQVVEGTLRGDTVLKLTLDMALDLPDPRDEVVIEGTPELEVTVVGGIHGDRATAATVVNAIVEVVSSRPGLIVSSDISPGRLVMRGSVDSDGLT